MTCMQTRDEVVCIEEQMNFIREWILKAESPAFLRITCVKLFFHRYFLSSAAHESVAFNFKNYEGFFFFFLQLYQLEVSILPEIPCCSVIWKFGAGFPLLENATSLLGHFGINQLSRASAESFILRYFSLSRDHKLK